MKFLLMYCKQTTNILLTRIDSYTYKQQYYYVKFIYFKNTALKTSNM